MLFEYLGRSLARFLSQPRTFGAHPATNSPECLRNTIRKGDVLLVEGNSRFSTAIKYLTQSTWSHAALCVGEIGCEGDPFLVEVDVVEGVRAVPLNMYASDHTRICRPVGLDSREIDQITDFVIERLGHRYDLRNIFDLARYLLSTPPVPGRWRRRLLSLGSGDPTRAICSSLIAQAFQSVHYPILPEITVEPSKDPACKDCYNEIIRVRHHSLFVPRDFDISPYFRIVKPTLAAGFNFHDIRWSEESDRSRGLLGTGDRVVNPFNVYAADTGRSKVTDIN